MRPTPFVPLANDSKGFAQAACAAFEGENEGPLVDLAGDVLLVELRDGELRRAESPDRLGDADIPEDAGRAEDVNKMEDKSELLNMVEYELEVGEVVFNKEFMFPEDFV